MTPFLKQIATLFYERYGEEIQQMAFVFPNRRAGLFFRKYLSQVAGKPLFSPTILTINGLFLEISEKKPADRLRLLFLLYHIYIRQSGSQESFDDFLYWGEMLLNDFDDVDKYLIDAKRLFTNVTDLRELEDDFSYMQEEQVAAIRSFWSTFEPKGGSESQQLFLELWVLLYPIYCALREQLSDEQIGYEGMIFREVVEQIKQSGELTLPYIQVVFVGLNALSTVELALLEEMKKREMADFYWDASDPKVCDPDNRASHFILRQQALFPSSMVLPKEERQEQEIVLMGIPSRIGQTKQVHTLLHELLVEPQRTDREETLRTAIVLPDEQLLVPLLHAIPTEIKRINVTLGYPLSGTPVASLMEAIAALQKNVRQVKGAFFFYHREVVALLNHPYLLSSQATEAQALTAEITRHNRIFVAADLFHQTPLFALIFQPIRETAAIADYLLSILRTLSRRFVKPHENEEEDVEEVVGITSLEREFIYHYYITVNRIDELIGDSGIEMSVETYFKLLKRLTDTITIPFQGEPLSGLQIMGVLETRLLDFDRLIILSMNEGLFPVKKTANSFVPYNLRRGFGLPTHEHQESVWAYHFYRLMARAKEVRLLYDTRKEGLQSGEVSRFVHQLRYHYEVPIQEQLLVYDVTSAQSTPLTVEKTPAVMERLSSFMMEQERSLSASSINMFLDCPLKFYFAAVEQMREEEEVMEGVESSLFGSILHQVMEEVYRPYCGAMVTDDLLTLTIKEKYLTKLIEQAYARWFFHTEKVQPLMGQNYLTGEIIRKYVKKIVNYDRKLTPFRYVESEYRLSYPFPLSDGRQVRLKGIIDRIDEVGGQLRLVDYKTGSVKARSFKSMESLFDRNEKRRPSHVMQLFLYSWLYRRVGGSMPIQPSLYYLRELFHEGFDAAIYPYKEKEPVTDFSPYDAPFEEQLRSCLDELFDPTIPFTQTRDLTFCSYCAFNELCGRST